MSTADSATTHHHAHHFDSADHEFQASKLGVWLFLVTEVMMFGGLFVGYLIYHNKFPHMFWTGAHLLDWKMGAFNTVVLLVSSFTMALSIYYAQKNNSKQCANMLMITFVCGLIFMVVKYLEYTGKFAHGIYPGTFIDPETAKAYLETKGLEFRQYAIPNSDASANLGLYFGFYYLMTGLHGSHVIIGMGMILWLWFRARKGEFNGKWYTPVEGVGLFWHLVDLIWIFLFPLLYLVE